jgi:hypothetical protein
LDSRYLVPQVNLSLPKQLSDAEKLAAAVEVIPILRFFLSIPMICNLREIGDMLSLVSGGLSPLLSNPSSLLFARSSPALRSVLSALEVGKEGENRGEVDFIHREELKKFLFESFFNLEYHMRILRNRMILAECSFSFTFFVTVLQDRLSGIIEYVVFTVQPLYVQ